MPVDLKSLRNTFERMYGGPPTVLARAPGRVNLIGEHTDYNDGFVLPMAIERETVVLARPRDDDELHAHSVNVNESAACRIGVWSRDPHHPWIDYLMGAACMVDSAGHPVRGMDCIVQGDVPLGSGLSSSASLEMALFAMFEGLYGITLEGPVVARMGQRLESEMLNVQCGIMDQFISRMGKAGHALMLDCRSLEYDLVPIAMPGFGFVIANTGVSRGLTDSIYNERVAECSEAVEYLNKAAQNPGTHLRDFIESDLVVSRDRMPDRIYRRARHVITENNRTLAACEAMRKGDATSLGDLMNASDASLRTDYEVTCPELDAMTEIARKLPGCYGARMTGAGFGGCTVSLVASDAVVTFCRDLLVQYEASTGRQGETIISQAADGARWRSLVDAAPSM